MMKNVFSIALAIGMLMPAAVCAQSAVEVSITPQHLSLTKSDVRFVRCNVPTGHVVANPAACSLAIDGAGAILAVKVESHIEEHDTTVVFFYVDDVRAMLAGRTGEVELTLSIDRDGDGVGDLVGSDTITVVD